MLPSWKKCLHGAELPSGLPKNRTAKRCECGIWFSVAACHAERHKSCSVACANKARKIAVDSRKTSCATCGADFIPRMYQIKIGQGRFCSTQCAMKEVSTRDSFKDARAKSGVTYKNSLALGRFKRLSGEDHPMWTGGRDAAKARRNASEKSRQYNKKYRSLNKERVREWSQKRKGRKAKTGRLPRGTVTVIYGLQRGLCANCKKTLPSNYHADHIMPLALGGKHEPTNIQLLCPPCNVRKWAYHPIEFAQKQGKLL